MLSERRRLVELLAPVRRLQPDVLPDAPARPAGDAPAGLHLPGRDGLGRPEPAGDGRRLPARRSASWSSSSTSCGAAAGARSPAPTPGAAGRWNGRPPRRRRATTSSTRRRSASRNPVWEDPPDAPVVTGLSAPTSARCWSRRRTTPPPTSATTHAATRSGRRPCGLGVGGPLIGLHLPPVAASRSAPRSSSSASSAGSGRRTSRSRSTTPGRMHPTATDGPDVGTRPTGDDRRRDHDRIRPPAGGLDVSHLPTAALDSASAVWWGNTLFMVIETTTIALLVASYFYTPPELRRWPPPQVDRPRSSTTRCPVLGAR